MVDRKLLLPLFLVGAALLFSVLGCAGASLPDIALFATETPTPTATSTATSTSTLTPTATPSPTVTYTPTITSTPPPTPTPGITASVLPNGWIEYTVPAGGMRLALPPEWLQIGLSEDEIEEALGAVGEQNPEYAETFSQQVEALIAQGIRFYAINTGLGFSDGLPTTLNVGTLDIGRDVSVEFFVDANLSQLEALIGANQITPELVKLPAGDAAIISYNMGRLLPNTPEAANSIVTQYLLVEDGVGYVFTMVTHQRYLSEQKASFRAIMETLEFVDFGMGADA